MSNLVKKVKTFFIGTTPEIKEKVGKTLGLGLYYSEFLAAGFFIGDALDGRFNPYLAPFTADAVVRMGRGIAKLVKDDYEFNKAFELPGIIGSVRELKQYSD